MNREINPSKDYLRITKLVLSKIDVMTATEEDIGAYLDTLKKSEYDDPLHKWIGTYNAYILVLKRFFKWFTKNPHSLAGIKRLKRKETSTYSPSDLWTQQDDLLFLKYCPSKRDKCYHVISRDTSCRPSEILRIKVKDIVFKMVGNDRQYAEVLVNGKTGSRQIPLIDSLPYLKDYLNEHVADPNTYLFRSAKTFTNLKSHTLGDIYARYKNWYFPKLLKDPDISSEDKAAIQELLKKPWNPYIRRHTALTEKSKILKEHILRSHAGWSKKSNMPDKYLHYFGNESSESILEAYGLKITTPEVNNKLSPVICPNCSEANTKQSRFCIKCRMILSYDSYLETLEKADKVNEFDVRVRKVIVGMLNDKSESGENNLFNTFFQLMAKSKSKEKETRDIKVLD
jgi:integrase